MAKYNKPTKNTSQTTNYEEALAFKIPKDLELYSTVVTSSLERKFYESGEDRLDRIRNLIKVNDPMFVAQLAIYTREQMYLRTMPLVLAVELTKVHSGDNLVSKLVARIVQRVDEIPELLAYYQSSNARKDAKKLNKLSKQIQLGLAQAFNKFDEYQFAKYNRQLEVKVRDALFLSHPKAKDKDQQVIFNKIVEGTLETPYTWETQLSALGQKKFGDEEAKKEAFKALWAELVNSGKLGYMALLRNLRNILETNPDQEILEKVCARIADKNAVLKSKQLPFRFLAAYRELSGEEPSEEGLFIRYSKEAPKAVSLDTGTILEALEDAIKHSAGNIKGFGYDTTLCIACDVSGSMQKSISPRSKIQNYDIGLMLGMLLQSKCKRVISGIFGNTFKVINLPKSEILHNTNELHQREGEVGYSTNGYKILEYLISNNLPVDKVMLFTDEQMWDSYHAGADMNTYWSNYKKIAPKAKLYLFDLAGYGNTPISVMRNDVNLIAGWSDKVFDILTALEEGKSTLDTIKRIDI